MMNRITTLTLAAALAPGIATSASAGPGVPGHEKAAYQSKATPAAQVVDRGAGHMTAGPTEKANQIARTSPAFEATGIEGTFIATHPTGKGEVRR